MFDNNNFLKSDTEIRNLIQSYITLNGTRDNPVSASNIINAIGLSSEQVYDALNDLILQSKIKRTTISTRHDCKCYYV